MNKSDYEELYIQAASEIPEGDRHLISYLDELFSTDPKQAYEELKDYLEDDLRSLLIEPLTLDETMERIDEKLTQMIHGGLRCFPMDPHILADDFSKLRWYLDEGHAGDRETEIYHLYEKIRDML